MGFSSHSKFKVLNVSKEGETNYYVMKEVAEKSDDKLMDAKIMATFNAQWAPAGYGKPSTNPSDKWVCALDDTAEVPKAVPQINVPAFALPK